ncbi:MAG TPA: MgtC/SapB family protein, partial [Sphingomonas sp.]|nr:MgtC/SapB family protein [Sphingomonas sp.]
MTGAGQPLLSLGYAVAIGLLVGLERGWTGRGEDDGHRVAGIRTFGLLGLVGGVAGLIGAWIGVAIVALSGIVLIVGYWRQTLASDGQSATGAVAGLLVLGLSALGAS